MKKHLGEKGFLGTQKNRHLRKARTTRVTWKGRFKYGTLLDLAQTVFT